MAKTLVALYHTMPEAEQVVHDLVQHGFAHSDIRLMTHNGAGRPPTATHAEHVAVGDGLREQLTELGVPEADARAYVEGVPHERVVQVHLAGHTNRGKYILDTHSDHVIDPVWDLYRRTCELVGNVSTLVEWDDDIPTFDVLLAEAEKARAIRIEVERARAA